MKRLSVLLPLLLGSAALLAACGVPGPAGAGIGHASAGKAVSSAARTEPAPLPASPGMATAASGAVAGRPVALSQASDLPPVSRMIVKNGSLSIAVADPETSLDQVDQIVRSEQGIIASQTVRNQRGKVFVNMLIQVDPGKFEDCLSRLRSLRASRTQPTIDSVSSQDVTGQYVDLQARYTNLRTTRDAYQALLKKATSIADVITLTREIGNVQTQMDEIKGRENLLSRQAGVSNINLSLSPVGANPEPGPRPLPGPGQAAAAAWHALLTGLRGLAVGLIWTAIILPLPALVVLGAWLVYRRLARPAAAR
ncbi:MAG: DUF4349 domain-containing protein [Chloroflexota bacterium]